MSQFIRVFQHLLPRSPVWALTFNKTLKKFFAGLAAPFDDTDPSKSPKAFADAVFSDIFPGTTRQLPKWLFQFGLEHGADDAADILQLQAAWQAQGGQDPKYLQDTLQSAGFPLYVHEWWQEGVPAAPQPIFGDPFVQCGEPTALLSSRRFTRFVRDPRLYTNQPLVGTEQLSSFADAALLTPTDPTFADQPQLDSFLVNNVGYLVNDDLSRNAPPAIPDDTKNFSPYGHRGGREPKPGGVEDRDWYPDAWPYFFYLGGANFPDRVAVPASRRAELERLALKLRPTHLWVVMLVDYIPDVDASVTVGGVSVTAGGVPVVIAGSGSSLVTLAGDTVTVGGSPVVASL